MNFLNYFICGCNTSSVKEFPKANVERPKATDVHLSSIVVSREASTTRNITELATDRLTIHSPSQSLGHSPTSSLGGLSSSQMIETVNLSQKKYLSNRELSRLSKKDQFTQSARHRRSTDYISISVKPREPRQHLDVPKSNVNLSISLPGALDESLEPPSSSELISPLSRSSEEILALQQQRDPLIRRA